MRRAHLKEVTFTFTSVLTKYSKHLGISLLDVQLALRILASLDTKSISNPIKQLLKILDWKKKQHLHVQRFLCLHYLFF